jgi:hypothetical protein
MDVLRAVSRGARDPGSENGSERASERASGATIGATIGLATIGLGALGLAYYMRKRDLCDMETWELLREYKNKKATEDPKLIVDVVVSRVHDLRDELYGAYGDVARKLIEQIRSRVEAKGDSGAKTAQLKFLNEALQQTEEAWKAWKKTAKKRAITGILSDVCFGYGFFGHAETKYGHVATWDVRRVTDMSYAFRATRHYTNEADWASAASRLADLTFWDTRRVRTMAYMFRDALTFNGEIGTWDTRRVRDMSGMFDNAATFNRDISAWNTGRVASMDAMFYGAEQFNGAIARWDVSNVRTAEGMFADAKSFNQNIGAWRTGSMRNVETMFAGASAFDQDVSGWDLKRAKRAGMFFDAGLSDENAIKVADKWELSEDDYFAVFGKQRPNTTMRVLNSFGPSRAFVSLGPSRFV